METKSRTKRTISMGTSANGLARGTPMRAVAATDGYPSILQPMLVIGPLSKACLISRKLAQILELEICVHRLLAESSYFEVDIRESYLEFCLGVYVRN